MSSDTPAVRVYQPPKTIRDAYLHLATTVAPLLPEGMNPKQFVGLVGSCIAKTPKLRACEPESFVLAVREAAELGLWPGTNAAALSYLVPKGGKVNFRLGYRGLEELAYRKGWLLAGAVVHKGDYFRWERGTAPFVVHRGRRSQPATGAELVYAYAICKVIRTGSLIDFEVLDRDDVEKRRRAGDAADGNWWMDHPARMWSKSAVRALGMRLPLAPSGQTLTQRGVSLEGDEEPSPSVEMPELPDGPQDPQEDAQEPEPRGPDTPAASAPRAPQQERLV